MTVNISGGHGRAERGLQVALAGARAQRQQASTEAEGSAPHEAGAGDTQLRDQSWI